MTTKTSLFNKGIYKSTVERFFWGSILYAVLIFIVNVLPILLVGTDYRNYYNLSGNILLTNYAGALILAMAVPTVVGLLVFRFMHSKKVAVFTHSLPVTRTGNYISTVLAAFTLMILPVVLNTAILVVMSLCGYGMIFSVGNCMVWMLVNLFALFIMFSCTCFVASLTGSSWALVALNVFIHVFLTIIATAMDLAAGSLLYGHPHGSVLTELLSEKSFPGVIGSIPGNMGINETVTVSTILIHLVIAVAFYIAALFLYKKRDMEKAEDVAGFGWLNPVFKYLVTFTAALGAYSFFIGMTMGEHNIILWTLVICISAIIYFACEMILKKTFKVFRSYKGFLAIAATCVVLTVFIMNTSFFGYETRVPKIEDVASIRIFNAVYFDGGFDNYDGFGENIETTKNPEVIKTVIGIHNDMIQNKAEYEKAEKDGDFISIEYRLKNGRKLTRVYFANESVIESAMEKVYSIESHKVEMHPIFDEISEIESLALWANNRFVIEENAEELIECIRKDVKELSYSELQSEDRVINLDLYYIKVENGKEYHEHYALQMNRNFKNTNQWLMDNGYWEGFFVLNEGEFYISEVNQTIWFEGETPIDITEEHKAGLIKLCGEEAEGIVKYINETACDKNGGKTYSIIHRLPDEDYATPIAYISQAQLDELIK